MKDFMKIQVLEAHLNDRSTNESKELRIVRVSSRLETKLMFFYVVDGTLIHMSQSYQEKILIGDLTFEGEDTNITLLIGDESE